MIYYILHRQKKRYSAQQVMSIFLACEKQRGSLSPWAAYINVLPESYTNAAYWTEHEVHLLPCHLQPKAQDQIKDVERSYMELNELICQIEHTWPALRGAVTFDMYRWAWSTINTRSVYIKQQRSQFLSEELDHYALAPFLDLLNHSSHVKVSVPPDGDKSGTLEV